MITLSLNFDKAAGGATRSAHEKKIRDILDTHLGFPGSDKLKMGVTIKDNGSASVSFTGPKDAIAEAKRLWNENVKPVAAKVRKAATRATKQVNKAVKKAAKKTAKKTSSPRAKVKTKPKTTKSAKTNRRA